MAKLDVVNVNARFPIITKLQPLVKDVPTIPVVFSQVTLQLGCPVPTCPVIFILAGDLCAGVCPTTFSTVTFNLMTFCRVTVCLAPFGRATSCRATLPAH